MEDIFEMFKSPEKEETPKTWDHTLNKLIETPKEMINFFREIDEVCKKYNLSISHEDGHGAFGLEEYDEFYIKWLKDAHKLY